MDHTTPDNLSKPPGEVPPLSDWECDVIRERLINNIASEPLPVLVAFADQVLDVFFDGNRDRMAHFFICESERGHGFVALNTGSVPSFDRIGHILLYIPIEFAREGIRHLQQRGYAADIIELSQEFFGLDGDMGGDKNE